MPFGRLGPPGGLAVGRSAYVLQLGRSIPSLLHVYTYVISAASCSGVIDGIGARGDTMAYRGVKAAQLYVHDIMVTREGSVDKASCVG